MTNATPAERPDFTIERLGPAESVSPLCQRFGASEHFFVGDDERVLFDIHGYAWKHDQRLADLDDVNLELAGPRRFIWFEPKQTRAAIVTCGGLCPGINNVIRSVTHCLALHYGVAEVLGIRYGFQGLVPDGPPPITLTPNLVEPIHERGGSFLGTSRGPQPIDAMLEFIRQRQINLLFTIGGDGTQRGALALGQAARAAGMNLAVVGIPKTIDNDLNFVEKTFGFETAFSIADQALKAAHAEAKGVINGVGIVKLMGRHSGYITTMASLSNGTVNLALVPEDRFEIHGPQGVLAFLEKRLASRGHAVIAVAEGAGQDLLAEEAARLGKDASGNQKLADIGLALRAAIENHFKSLGIAVGVRYIDPSYMIRSAPATPNDSAFCLELAYNAVHAGMSGRTNLLVGIWKNAFTHVPLREVVKSRKSLDPTGTLWLSLVQATGQPLKLRNTPNKVDSCGHHHHAGPSTAP
jgi:6-phosphofructokinase 1